ncbi:hypothetical protein DB345_03445 [Spartobacteria bacterium LR76]|nr:hypothetical protein DB345_03445 [Spartobacteria bacterium LR76]
MSALRISVSAVLACLISLGNASSETNPANFAIELKKSAAMVSAGDVSVQKEGFSRIREAAEDGYLPAINALAWYRIAADCDIPEARELLKKYESSKNLRNLTASDKRYFEISNKITKAKDWSPVFESENLLSNESGMSPLAAKSITSPFFREKITAIPDAEPLVPASFWETSLGSSWRDAVGRFPHAEPFTYEGDEIPPIFADTPLTDLGWKASTNKFVVLKFSNGTVNSAEIIFHNPSSKYITALIKEISRTVGYTPNYTPSRSDRSTGMDQFITPISWEPAQSPGTVYVLDTSDESQAVLTKRRK